MKSTRGVIGAGALLLALPVTIVYQMLFAAGAEAVLHLCLAIGALFVAAAAFDFKATRWMTLMGSVSATGLAVIFVVQAAASVVPNEQFSYFAFQTLAVVPEGLFLAGLMTWLCALALSVSHGPARILGCATAIVGLSAEIYSYGLLFANSFAVEVPQALRLLYLLPFVWFVLESRVRPARVLVSTALAPATA